MVLGHRITSLVIRLGVVNDGVNACSEADSRGRAAVDRAPFPSDSSDPSVHPPRVPVVVLSGTGSGVGKTTVACALACALAERGVDVRLFKGGPDYLDPTFHQAATGRPARNLDPWMAGVQGVLDTLDRGTRDLVQPGLAIVEGMMGLFDGRSPESLEGSTAALAQLLGCPVVLVVDASGMARSATAMIEGFANHTDDVDVRGVIYNRVGSTGHTRLLEETLRGAATRLPVRSLGGLPADDARFLPSRHLGLLAAHVSDATRTAPARAAWRRALASWASEHLDLDGLLALARTSAGPPPAAATRLPPVGRARIGFALDEAFHFYYPDNLELLREAGAELVPWSPLSDARLPQGLDGLYIGGGYPEAHARTLAANRSLRDDLRAFATSGRPVHAECGGLMYLGEWMVDQDGERHAMVGALPLTTAMEPTLRTLGYREVTTTRDTWLGPAGTVFRGHEFHYSHVAEAGDVPKAWRWQGWRGEGEGGYVLGGIIASYVHACWSSNPELPRAFVRACIQARR